MSALLDGISEQNFVAFFNVISDVETTHLPFVNLLIAMQQSLERIGCRNLSRGPCWQHYIGIDGLGGL